MLILFVVGRGCRGLAPTVFSRIIICSMCVGMSECVCVCAVCWQFMVYSSLRAVQA